MWALAVSILCLLTGSTVADVEGHSAGCYQITTSIIVGVVVGDLLLTVLLLIPVYYCTRPKDTRPIKRDEGKNYVNMIGIKG